MRAMFARIVLLTLAASIAIAGDAPLPQPPADAVAFTPRYPLWTDGMSKRRWLHVPKGASIDKTDPDAWEFPRGTRVERIQPRRRAGRDPRTIERLADGSWRYLTYAWNASGTAATLAPEDGIPERGIPSRADCLACHEGAGADPRLQRGAAFDLAAPALGYLHGNWWPLPQRRGAAGLDLTLQQRSTDLEGKRRPYLRIAVGRASRFRPPWRGQRSASSPATPSRASSSRA